jgi:hypothetical protein
VTSTEQSVPPPVPRPIDAPKPADWRGAVASLGIGLGGAILGLLPWIVTGMRLPLQNLWSRNVLPDEMPVAWLPLSQYNVSLLIGLMVVGSAAAGIAARALRDRLPSRAPLSITAGVLFVQVVATAQAVSALAAGLQSSEAATIYLAACIALTVFAIVCGLVVLGLIARGPRPGAVIALTLAAIASGWWLSGFIAPIGSAGGELTYALLDIARWVPPVLVGAAIAWGGTRTPGRIVAAVVSLLLLWIVPALATAVTSAVGSRILLPYPLEMLDYGWGVFTMAVLMPELVVPPLIVAIVVAAAGIGLRELLLARRRGSALQ